MFGSRFEWLDQPLARRGFMARAAGAALGVSVYPWDTTLGQTAVKSGKAKQIIYLMMKGAMSHIDTFDPKPGREVQGETKTTQCKTPGMVIGEHLKRLASLSDNLAIIRSLSTETGAHEPGTYLMRTAYKQLNSIRHPGLGAWSLHAAGRISKELPGNVLIGTANDHPGAGFLDPGFSPVPVAEPAKGLENTKPPSYLSDENFARRLTLAGKIDDDFRKRYKGDDVAAYNQMYKDAVQLMGSKELKAFDINEESEAVREAYGTSRFGQGCLLARRLVQAGVRFIEVEYGTWDMHQDIFTDLPDRVGGLDQGMGSLIKDLEAKGLLSSTLVVLGTEFGRTPTINQNAGRDHHPGVFSCVLAGAGIRGGQVYGSSDVDGRSPAEDAVSVADFNTTIAAAAGLPYEREFNAPNGRPFKIGGGGTPIKKILA
jgi:hypothetical protein